VRRGERRFLPPNAALERYHRGRMRQPPFLLSDPEARAIVRDAIVRVCEVRAWNLHALHVRTNHVHGVVEAPVGTVVVNAWKVYATRALRAGGLVGGDRVVWTHGASCRCVGSAEGLRATVRYVLEGQGEVMATFVADPALTHGAGRDVGG
jgi:REP element-mobilizing transposase RayT